MFNFRLKLQAFILLHFCQIALCFCQTNDPLPSWNEGHTKHAIIQFIADTTTPGSKDYIPGEDRIAVFDQDGTLWVEHPIYTQFYFLIDAVKNLLWKHPLWIFEQPFKAILEGDIDELINFAPQQIAKIIAACHAEMTTDEFIEHVQMWLTNAVHPKLNKKFTQLIYQPMLEVMEYFRSHGYKTYIVSGGGQEFIRAYSEKVYGIPIEQVIGTAGKVKYDYQDGHPVLVKLPLVLFIDDKDGKPEAINLFIGKKPVAAFGNSDGDQQMLEWSQSSNGKSFQLLVHHDDSKREYKYDTHTHVGKFSHDLMEEAQKNKWHVVSMKNDWKVVFPSEHSNKP